MNVLAISFAFNEKNFIEYKYNWSKDQGFNLYVIDNFSDDGTWEYLKEKNIPSHRFDTNGEFHLKKLQAELIKTIHLLKPDWVIYMGIDEFIFHKSGLRNEIIKADQSGFKSMEIQVYNFFNTGESDSNNVFNKYFFYNKEQKQIRIIKYDNYLRLAADNFVTSKTKINTEIILLNYGMTKSKEERELTLQRRKKAWENDLSRGLGVHYNSAQKINWIWKKETLNNIKNSDFNWVLNELNKNIS